MPSVSLLIKPVSSACNMNCTYCFYQDVSSNRLVDNRGVMSLELLETLVRTASEQATDVCSLAFQGGEPTLAGLSFYQELLNFENKYKKPGLRFQNSIQTNGYSLGQTWARFFAENHFLVGVSVDGPSEMHNRFRHDHSGNNTWSEVLRSVNLLKKNGVLFNILCVLTEDKARKIQSLYNFYKKNGMKMLQFIPCLEPLNDVRGSNEYYLSSKAYGEFLIKIFDLWYHDLLRGEYVSIRHIDNLINMAQGKPCEACNMNGVCSVQYVVEADGSVYPCDFYATDEYYLGNVLTSSFDELKNSDDAKRFIEESRFVPEKCQACSFYPICRNGCRRDRISEKGSLHGLNFYCEAYETFFRERIDLLFKVAEVIKKYG